MSIRRGFVHTWMDVRDTFVEPDMIDENGRFAKASEQNGTHECYTKTGNLGKQQNEHTSAT